MDVVKVICVEKCCCERNDLQAIILRASARMIHAAIWTIDAPRQRIVYRSNATIAARQCFMMHFSIDSEAKTASQTLRMHVRVFRAFSFLNKNVVRFQRAVKNAFSAMRSRMRSMHAVNDRHNQRRVRSLMSTVIVKNTSVATVL